MLLPWLAVHLMADLNTNLSQTHQIPKTDTSVSNAVRSWKQTLLPRFRSDRNSANHSAPTLTTRQISQVFTLRDQISTWLSSWNALTPQQLSPSTLLRLDHFSAPLSIPISSTLLVNFDLDSPPRSTPPKHQKTARPSLAPRNPNAKHAVDPRNPLCCETLTWNHDHTFVWPLYWESESTALAVLSASDDPVG